MKGKGIFNSIYDTAYYRGYTIRFDQVRDVRDHPDLLSIGTWTVKKGEHWTVVLKKESNLNTIKNFVQLLSYKLPKDCYFAVEKITAPMGPVGSNTVL